MNEKRQHPVVRILRFFLKIIKAYFISIGVFVTLVPLTIAYFVARSHPQTEPTFRKAIIAEKESVLLKFDLEGVLSDRSPGLRETLWSELVGEDLGVQMSNIETALRRARNDKRVKGVFFDVRSFYGPPNLFSELRSRIANFKTSGKPIYFSAYNIGNEELLLSSVADRLNLDPAGGAMVTGPILQMTYFKDALDKLGIELTVVKEGQFKSAMEPFVANEPSQPTQEMYKSIESNLRNHLVDAVVTSRKIDEKKVRGWLDRGFFTAEQAKKELLVTDSTPRDLFELDFKKTIDADSVVEFEKYLDATEDLDERSFASGNSKIALLEAKGTIFMDEDNSAPDSITPDSFNEQLSWAMDEDDVKAVVIRIDSPGGSALASDIIGRQVRKLREKKPVVVSMGGVAASGGYYIAAPATKIIADPTTITGSIGVISAIPHAAGFTEKWGVHFHTFSGSARKDVFNFGAKPNPEDLAILAEQMKDTYKLFLNVVAEGRKIPLEKVEQLAQGRVYTGIEAKSLGLIDEFGGMADAFQEAKTLAGLDPNKLYTIAHYEESHLSFMECLKSSADLRGCLEILSISKLISQHTLANPASEVLTSVQNWYKLAAHERILALSFPPQPKL
ncbi:MAG: signal peptide peptidase SppA [Oligoflexales bacterium]